MIGRTHRNKEQMSKLKRQRKNKIKLLYHPATVHRYWVRCVLFRHCHGFRHTVDRAHALLFCAQVQADKVKGMFEQIDLDGPGPVSHVLWMTPPRACHVRGGTRSAADLGGKVCAPRA